MTDVWPVSDVTHRPPAVAPVAPPASPLRALLDAQRLISRDLTLADMITRIAEAACRVSGAAYARMLLLGVDGEIVGWGQHGLSEREVESLTDFLGPVSHGRGSVDERVGQMAAGGLRCFPILSRRERIAELYLPRATPMLAEDETGAHDGTADGADLLAALLGVIGTALESAMLHAEAQRSKDWLHASGEIARALLADQGADTLIDVLHRALYVAEVDYAALCLARTDGMLEVTVAAGIGADLYQGMIIDPAKSQLAAAVINSESVLASSFDDVTRPDFDNELAYGPVMMVPLADAHGVRGSVVFCRLSGRPPFTVRDLDHAAIFADQIVLALEMDDARAQGVWLSLLEDRHRIAQDLHDNVMQRLFAIGVGLESLAAAALPPEIARRLGRYIADHRRDDRRHPGAGVRAARQGTDRQLDRGHHPLPATSTQ